MKKLTVLSILLAFTLIISACSGMSSTALTANWHNRSDVEYDPDFYEELTYNVSYDDETATNTNYCLKNISGTYTVKVSAGVSLPTEDGGTLNELYKMETKLVLSGTYAKKDGEDIYAYTGDTVESVVYFHRLGGGYNMQPVKSETSYSLHAPGRNSLSTVNISLVKYTVTMEYNDACSKVQYTVKDKTDEIGEIIPDDLKNYVVVEKAQDAEKTFSKLQKSYSYFDTAQLYFIGRGITYSENSTNTVSTIPGNLAQNVKAQFTCSSISSRRYSFTDNNEEVTKDISSAEVSLKLNEGNSSGSAIKLYYAVGTQRNMLLSFEEPYSFGLGKLVYSLQNVSTTKPE